MQNELHIVVRTLNNEIERLQYENENLKRKIGELIDGSFDEKWALIEKHLPFLRALGAREDVYFKISDKDLPLSRSKTYVLVPVEERKDN